MAARPSGSARRGHAPDPPGSGRDRPATRRHAAGQERRHATGPCHPGQSPGAASQHQHEAFVEEPPQGNGTGGGAMPRKDRSSATVGSWRSTPWLTGSASTKASGPLAATAAKMPGNRVSLASSLIPRGKVTRRGPDRRFRGAGKPVLPPRSRPPPLPAPARGVNTRPRPNQGRTDARPDPSRPFGPDPGPCKTVRLVSRPRRVRLRLCLLWNARRLLPRRRRREPPRRSASGPPEPASWVRSLALRWDSRRTARPRWFRCS